MLQIKNKNESGYKKGRGLKSRMSRGNQKYVLCGAFLFSIMCLLQSCAMLTLRGHQASLNHKSTYQGVDVDLTTPVGQSFDIDFYLGAGKLDLSKSDFVYPDAEKLSTVAPSVGIGGAYYFSKRRLQPFLSFELNDMFWSTSKKGNEENKDTTYGNYYFTTTPKFGLRYYISNKIALNASLGYQFGTVNYMDVSNKVAGFMPSIGISFVLMNKIK